MRTDFSGKAAILSVWYGPLLLVLLGCIVAVIKWSSPGDRLYARGQNGLLFFCIGAALLFLTRTRVPQTGWQYGTTLASKVRSYWRSGTMGVDLFFVAVALAACFVLNVANWRRFGVKVGVVVGIAMLRLAHSSMRR